MLREQQAAAANYRAQASSELLVRAPPPAPTSPAPETPCPAGACSPGVDATKAGRQFDDAALVAIAPSLAADERAEILVPLLAAMREFAINTPLRQAAFVAQLVHESGTFRFTIENLNYTAAALRRVWPTVFPTNELAEAYERKPERIANRIYAGKFGNGPEESGDGWRFRGRGPFQVVGRDSYRRFGIALGVDLETEPDLAAEWSLGFRTAGVFWTSIDGQRCRGSR